MRKRTGILIITLIGLLAVIALWIFGIYGSRKFGVKAADKRLVAKIERGTESAPDFGSILFDGDPVAYDETTGTIFISQDMETSGWEGNLTATDGTLYFAKNNLLYHKAEAISGGQQFTLYKVKGDTYQKFKIVFSGMPIMAFDTWSEVGDEIWGGAFSLYDISQKGAEYQSTPCNFAVRGNGARAWEKKSYKLTLSDEKLSLCGLRKDDDWTVNALYDDIGSFRNATCYRLWNEISATNSVDGDNAPECAYVELLVDHEYRGLYLLCDRVDKKKTKVTGDDYLFKFQNFARDETDEKMLAAFSVEEPKEVSDDSEKKKAAKNIMLDFINSCDIRKPLTGTYEDLSKQVYLDNAADYFIYVHAISGNDNIYKNSYFGAINQGDDTYKFYELPWDMNATFGINGNYRYIDGSETVFDTWAYVGATLYKLDYEEFSKVLKERYEVLRATVLSEENIKGVARDYLDYIKNSGAEKRNYDKFPYYKPESVNIDYKELWDEEKFFNFVDERMPAMDEFMESVYEGIPQVPAELPVLGAKENNG